MNLEIFPADSEVIRDVAPTVWYWLNEACALSTINVVGAKCKLRAVIKWSSAIGEALNGLTIGDRPIKVYKGVVYNSRGKEIGFAHKLLDRGGDKHDLNVMLVCIH